MPIVDSFKEAMINLPLAEGTLKVMLLSSSHTTNTSTQEFISDVSANEVSGTGYTAGGMVVADVVVSVSAGKVKIDFTDPTFSTVTLSDVDHAAFYIDTSTPGTSRLINIIPFDTTQSRSEDDLILEINSGGLFDGV